MNVVLGDGTTITASELSGKKGAGATDKKYQQDTVILMHY